MAGLLVGSLTAAAGRRLLGRRAGGLGLRLGRGSARRPLGRGLAGRLLGGRLSGSLALALGLGRRSVPVVDHLDGEDEVEGEAGDESVEDELVIDLLEGGKDTGQRAAEVVEDL